MTPAVVGDACLHLLGKPLDPWRFVGRSARMCLKDSSLCKTSPVAVLLASYQCVDCFSCSECAWWTPRVSPVADSQKKQRCFCW